MARIPLPPLRNAFTGVSHAMAHCMTCDWTSSSYKNALGTAAIHARASGHHVRAEQMVDVEYNRPDQEQP
jgi:hypothetical protein